MYLIVNTYACGGSAVKKWELIKSSILKKFSKVIICNLNNSLDINTALREAERNYEKDFIIAGGDGTVNFFINNLIDSTNTQEIKKFRIGAIGIGSSNDFHKPIKKENLINKIPAKINFNDFQPRDVGVIKYRSGNQILHKYFLLNASIGITAAANQLFNKPDLILKFLKKYFTAIAIVYAALKTILTYKNFEGEIIFSPYEGYSFHISNLSILKSPNISGDLSYPGKADYQNGLYDVYLTHSMNKLDLINLLKSLSKQTFPKNEKTKYCKTSKLKVTAAKDFLIEFDGETISTNNAEFSILNKYLNICTN
jgi:diacylglycerol kinase family enzyme